MSQQTQTQADPRPVADLFPYIIAACVPYWFGQSLRASTPFHFIGPDNRVAHDKTRVRGFACPFEAVAWMEAHAGQMPLGYGQEAFLCYRGQP